MEEDVSNRHILFHLLSGMNILKLNCFKGIKRDA